MGKVDVGMYLTAWGQLYRVADIYRSITPDESTMIQIENVETSKFAWIEHRIIREYFEEVSHAS